jgi:hypothetical protein
MSWIVIVTERRNETLTSAPALDYQSPRHDGDRATGPRPVAARDRGRATHHPAAQRDRVSATTVAHDVARTITCPRCGAVAGQAVRRRADPAVRAQDPEPDVPTRTGSSEHSPTGNITESW